MNSVTVEELVMRIEIELDKFRSQSSEAERLEKRLRSSLQETKRSADSASEGFVALGESVGESNKELTSKAKTIVDVTKRLVGFFAVIAGSNAISRFVTGISQANDQLNFLSQRLGMSARDIKGIDTAIAALGGKNASAINSIASLNQGIQEMVLMGNDALIPFFSAMGVSVVDASGAVREMDDILLDMSDSLSRMDPRQAYALANAIGLDEGVTNALMQGRDAMQDMLDLHKQIYVSSKAELETSRELSKAQALLSAQWEGLKTIIANMLTPALLHITKVVSGWVDYLNRNERQVRAFFVGISTAIGVVLLPLLIKGAIATIAFMSPFLLAALAVAGLGAAIALLYDDYKTWAEGGKSLFDWGGFIEYITGAELSIDNLKNAFARLLTGYNSWSEAAQGFKDWLKNKGLVDENGIAIRNLGHAFRELAKDILNASPVLQSIVAIIDHLTSGRWGEAAKEVARLPALMMRGAYDVSAAVTERGASAIDVMLGHNPDEGGSLTAWLRRGTAAISNKISDVLGLERTREDKKDDQPSSFTAAPIEGFTKEESEAYANALAKRESGGRLDAVNKWGYTGLYQFGASALAEVGYIDRKKLTEAAAGVKSGSNAKEHKAFLEDPENWLIGDYETFRNSREMQDEALKRLTEKNLKWTKSAHGGDKQKMFGAAMAAHLKGAGHANKWYSSGKDSSDGLGTNTSDYAKLGESVYASVVRSGNGEAANNRLAINESIANKTVDNINESIANNPTGALTTDSTAASANAFKRLLGAQDKVELKAPASSAVSKNVSVNVGSVTVNTAANTLPAATAEGVAAGIERSSGLLDQLGGGLV